MITAISPIDGRYSNKTKHLSGYFSEYALIRERVTIEILYLEALMASKLDGIPQLDPTIMDALKQMAKDFSEDQANEVKKIESRTNHDVKAVEYFIKSELDRHGNGQAREWVHFGLTSQDINNTAFPALIKRAVEEVILPSLDHIIDTLANMAEAWHGIPMLARTHGQPASPTTVGKEVRVFVERLQTQQSKLKHFVFEAKFGGATGNFNAHLAAYPDFDWKAFADNFVDSLGLKRQQSTTQIEHYDSLAELFHLCIRVNTILLDLCRDFWTYIALEYFGQKSVAHEVGSSTMPHKVNPIDFENAEGNLGISTALFDHLATKLPVSRLQRDLTDSTVLRNVGVPFAHLYIAVQSLQKGLGKVTLNSHMLEADLDNQWAVLAEPIQTILRREGIPEAYEILKGLTRGKRKVSKEDLHLFIENLPVDERVKTEMKRFTPGNYTGYH